MTDPKRLLDGGGTDLEQLLLASGRAARPKATARWKTEAALFFLAVVGVVGKAKSAVPGSKLYAWSIVRYAAYGLGAGATAWSAAQVLAHRPSDPPAAVEVAHVRPLPAPTRPVDPPRTEVTPPDVLVELPSADPKGTRVSPAAPPDRAALRAPRESSARSAMATGSSSSSPQLSAALASEPAPGASLGGEIQELDRARGALGAGDARGALGALDRYERAFPKGALQQEALRLRVEALVAANDRAAARSLAHRFRALYPNSTYAKRLNSLVNEP
jgi:hypothetical protein